ncbi:hypothetical protein GCM10028795_26940 [Lysobacter olei]
MRTGGAALDIEGFERTVGGVGAVGLGGHRGAPWGWGERRFNGIAGDLRTDAGIRHQALDMVDEGDERKPPRRGLKRKSPGRGPGFPR